MNVQVRIAGEARRKRLGQFFSGLKVGRLLAALAKATEATRIIDPMVGCGDLLQACLDLGACPDILAGIEIDAAVAAIAAHNLADAILVEGSAFDPMTLTKLPSLCYNLVIGNPPFVRYQDGSSQTEYAPEAAAVRRQLAQSIALMSHLPEQDRQFIADRVASYSGLADLAVPACLLSMSLVDLGGRLALVLPQAWLTRNYASPIRECLDAMFDIETLVEDDTADWFPDALVKTSLLVARRRAFLVGGDAPAYRHIYIGVGAADEHSLVGCALAGSGSPEIDFAALIESPKPEFSHPSINISMPKPSGKTSQTGQREDDAFMRIVTHLSSVPFPVSRLHQLGVSVGQGLRTGANEFFYVTPSDERKALIPAASFNVPFVDCPPEVLRPAIRDQRGKTWCILDLRSHVLPEDMPVDTDVYSVMQPSLASHVRRAATTLSGKPGREKPIPDLSAVKTNLRPSRNDSLPRFWYMLPDFQPRHLPDVFLPRVCADRPFAQSADRTVLVDANFVTFRCEGSLSPDALLALLHSSWAWAWLEFSGAVLGGGALKLESTILKRLPIPILTADQSRHANAIGDLIRTGYRSDAVNAIDEMLLEPMNLTRDLNNQLRSLASYRMNARTMRNI